MAGQVKPGPAGSVEMVASRDISAEEDLLLSYGMLNNTFLLLDYGAAQPREQQCLWDAHWSALQQRHSLAWLRKKSKALGA